MNIPQFRIVFYSRHLEQLYQCLKSFFRKKTWMEKNLWQFKVGTDGLTPHEKCTCNSWSLYDDPEFSMAAYKAFQKKYGYLRDE